MFVIVTYNIMLNDASNHVKLCGYCERVFWKCTVGAARGFGQNKKPVSSFPFQMGKQTLIGVECPQEIMAA